MENEQWKDIPGYERYYRISNMGRVKSLERTVDAGNRKYKVKGKILTNQKAVNNHFVRLTINGKSESIMIEKTVREIFGNNNGWYPGKEYQMLFNHLHDEYGLILVQSELDDIIRICTTTSKNHGA